jgi:Rrf2 family protein
MRLQKKSLYALYAVAELAAAKDRHLSTAEIAEKYDISPHHLAKVMMPLVRAGMLRSVRGVGGGYQFCGNERRITLLQVIEIFEAIGAEQDDPDLEKARASSVGAALEQIRGEIDALSRATLQSITLATLLDNVKRL